MRIEQNCIINGMPEDVYHGDPTPLAATGFKEYTALSSSVALAMLEETEIEARGKINRFNRIAAEESGEEVEAEKETFAAKLGTIAHEKVLTAGTGKAVYEVVPYDSFRKDDAKAARDDLLSRGIIPLAQNKKTENLVAAVEEMDNRLHQQLDGHKDYPGLLRNGKGEQSGFYFDEKLGIWKRARFDWLDEAYPDIVWDYKTTALPIQKWINNELWKAKYVQSAHYRDVHAGITGLKSRFGFIVQRVVKPFVAYVVVIDESFSDEVAGRYDIAQKRFVNCLKTGIWRGAPEYALHAYPPTWIIKDWEDQAMMEESVLARDKELADRANPVAKADPVKFLGA